MPCVLAVPNFWLIDIPNHLFGILCWVCCYNNHICIYFTLPTWKEKELKIWQNTRQTDNDHTRWYLIWKDKIRHRSKHTPIMMTNQRPCAHWRWHHRAPEHEHTKEQCTQKTEHLIQKHGPTWNNEMNPKMNHDAYPEGDKGMSQNRMHIHMTHRTNTSKHFTPFHCNNLHHWPWQKIY